MAVDFPGLSWTASNATVLPGDQVVFRLGDQIVLADLNTSLVDTKVAGEGLLQAYSASYGLDTACLRYFNVYGPGQTSEYAGVITRFARRVLKERPPVIFGNGSQTRDFVFVDDVVKATLTSLQKPLPGGTIMNIGTGRPIRIVSLAEKILGILNLRHLRPVFVSPRKGDVKYSEADISLARAKINFRPSHSLDSGLRATIEWLRRAN